MKKTKLLALTLVGMMAFSSATPVFAETNPEKPYTMTVPTGNTSIATDKTFSSIGELSVTSSEAFDPGSKVEVTVNRKDVLTNTDSTITSNNTIAYDLYTGTAIVAENKVADGDKIVFSASQIDAKTPIAMGVAISGDNYAQLEYGDYRDTITFTAEVAEVASYTVAITKEDIPEECEGSFTVDGITMTSDRIDGGQGSIKSGGTIASSSGKILQIVVEGQGESEYENPVFIAPENGWKRVHEKYVWTGNASSVSFEGHLDGGKGEWTIAITIEGEEPPLSKAKLMKKVINMVDAVAEDFRCINMDFTTLSNYCGSFSKWFGRDNGDENFTDNNDGTYTFNRWNGDTAVVVISDGNVTSVTFDNEYEFLSFD